MKILVFAASSSTRSINKKFVTSVSKYYKEDEVKILDLNDFEVPTYSADKESDIGIPEQIIEFAAHIDWADLILISFAEHNGNYSVAYKNVTDWVSRIPGRKIYQGARLFLLSTSQGARGGASVLSIATERIPHDGGEVLETYSLPEFGKNFEEGKGVIDPMLRSRLESKVRKTKKLMAAILTS